ncbi:sigma-70 family RNA polymerase sigma factor [Massilia sp. DD77]|uniref:sigma-70 family RNA polymerase sigma factor n=1 Tax=Massilia sp. DD77 TaxID=3109349 RepID=UPI0030006CC6
MESHQQDLDWHAVFVECLPQLRRTAFKVLGNMHWAQDVVQNTYLKMSEAGAMGTVRQPAAYLSRMVRNMAIDTYRRAALEASLLADEEQGEAVPSCAGTPESLMESRQDLRIVADTLAGLPERTRTAFELHRLGGLTQREVGKQLGVSVTLVNFMIRDALALCDKALCRTGSEPASGA